VSSTDMIDVFSRAAGTYDSVGPRHFRYFARELVEFAGVRPGSRVLDVATGPERCSSRSLTGLMGPAVW